MELKITNEEIDALKNFLGKKYEVMNQLLVSNTEADISLLSDEVENKPVSISYDRESVIKYMMDIKSVYSLILKQYYQNGYKSKEVYRGTNIAEIERLKNEPYIDKFLTATMNKNDAETKYSSVWSRPSSMNIILDRTVPYIFIKDFVTKATKNDVLITPFTRIKAISNGVEKDITVKGVKKTLKTFDVILEKQELQKLNSNERMGLFNYITEQAYQINKKLDECITLEKENAENFDQIRKLEQLLSQKEALVEEKELTGNYNDADRKADIDDIGRVNRELNELKDISTNLFEVRKSNINFVNTWKRNIAVYLIAECCEIENKICGELGIDMKTKDESQDEVKEEIEEKVEDTESVEEPLKEKTEEEIEKEKILEVVNAENPDVGEKVEAKQPEEDKEEVVEVEEKDEEPKKEEVAQETKVIELPEKVVRDKELENNRYIKEADENIAAAEKLLEDTKNLISKQQNHAKIAGSIGSNYSALNNAFEMRDVINTLINQMRNIKSRIEVLIKDGKSEEELERISKNSIEINTLINYFNNPKIAIGNSNITRFDEMAIIEENELKRGIQDKVRGILGEAELKKIKDDKEIIMDRTPFERFIGFFTGKNKLCDALLEQIELRQRAIRATLARKLSLAHNYSIHEIMALIQMFILDNEEDDSYDEIVEPYINELKNIAEELRRNYIISDSKVQTIIFDKEGRNLPLEDKRMSKEEKAEINNYRFLRKYGYDENNTKDEDLKYHDTSASELSRIVSFINTAKII